MYQYLGEGSGEIISADMKAYFILSLVISLLFHDCRASFSENQIFHPADNGRQNFMNSNFVPGYGMGMGRTSRSETTSQKEPNRRGEQWQEILYGKDPKQILYGGITGWLAGFFAMKAGKVAATAITGGAVLLAVANYNDLISINWDNVNNGVQNVSSSIKPETHSWGYKVASFVNENKHAAVGFGLGFALGVFSS